LSKVIHRTPWSELTEEELLRASEVDTYRASGPGGQKRNKTSSAVRLRHGPTGLIVIAEESRSQHENRAKAAQRLRQAIFLEIRESVPESQRIEGGLADLIEWKDHRETTGRLTIRPKHADFWPMMGRLLDALESASGQVSTVASWLNVTTANIIDLLELDPRVWQEANQIRVRFGQKQLRPSS
jgi:hypothetical protein